MKRCSVLLIFVLGCGAKPLPKDSQTSSDTGTVVVSDSGIVDTESPDTDTDTGDPDTDTDTDTDTGNVQTMSVAEVQKGQATGSTVLFKEVVVTSPLVKFDGGGASFFVQDLGGGPYSGIQIYSEDGFGRYEPTVGDLIGLQGTVKEFYDMTQLLITDAADVVDHKHTEKVIVSEVEPATVKDWEAWESCLVNVGPLQVISMQDEYGEAKTDIDLKLGDYFYGFVVQPGAKWSEVVGIIGYAYGSFQIWPRTEADLIR